MLTTVLEGSPSTLARMAQPKGVDWTVIILTCQYKDSVEVFQRELEVRQKREQIPAGTLLLAVEDPESRVGSGGATLNALLVAAEHLSARAGFTVITSDVLHSARILILHMGRDFPFDDCGRAFTCLPVENPQAPVEAVVCNLDCLLDIMSYRVSLRRLGTSFCCHSQRDQLGWLPGSQSDCLSRDHRLRPEPWCLPHRLPGFCFGHLLPGHRGRDRTVCQA